MIPAHYSLIRYIPDAARGEQLNVGIVAWTGSQVLIDTDDRAIERVVRENPHLAKDALIGLRDQLRDELGIGAGEAVAARLEGLSGFPVVATEPRQTMLEDESREALEKALARLLARVVRPRRRSGGGANEAQALERRMQPWIDRRDVVRDQRFRGSRSGLTRTVDYCGAIVEMDSDTGSQLIVRSSETRFWVLEAFIHEAEGFVIERREALKNAISEEDE